MGDLTWAAIAAGCFGLLSLYVQHSLNKPLRRKIEQVDTAVGCPNGEGNLVEMVEQLLRAERHRLYWQESTERRLSQVEGDVKVLMRGQL